jgi:hypothetical protein
VSKPTLLQQKGICARALPKLLHGGGQSGAHKSGDVEKNGVERALQSAPKSSSGNKTVAAVRKQKVESRVKRNQRHAVNRKQK